MCDDPTLTEIAALVRKKARWICSECDGCGCVDYVRDPITNARLSSGQVCVRCGGTGYEADTRLTAIATQLEFLGSREAGDV